MYQLLVKDKVSTFTRPGLTAHIYIKTEKKNPMHVARTKPSIDRYIDALVMDGRLVEDGNWYHIKTEE